MPGVLSAGVLGKNSTPKTLVHTIVENLTLPFLANFVYFKNTCSKEMKSVSKCAEGSTFYEQQIHVTVVVRNGSFDRNIGGAPSIQG